MAWLISWKSLLMLWAGGPLFFVGIALAACFYCSCCMGGGAAKKLAKKRQRSTLPL
jgi:hypothetical protein